MAFSAHSFASSDDSSLTVELVPNSLSLGTWPIQEGEANSNFIFNFNLILPLVPEIAYQITNNNSISMNNLELKTILPTGLMQAPYIYGDCPNQFILYPKQSCRMRFSVDINSYVPTSGNDPLICSLEAKCYWPIYEQQFNNAILLASETTKLKVTPEELDGLSYDPTTLSIIGKPSRAGSYVFKVEAYNKYTTSQPQYLKIRVFFNPKDKPVFKKDINIPSASPNQDYQLNLMDLIEPTPGFMKTNQVQFSISPNYPSPKWLSINKEIKPILQGHVPNYEAGNVVSVGLTASSNTGGDAFFLLNIPVASDPTQKPIIKEGIELSAKIAERLENDIKWYITDPAKTYDLKIIIDSITPEASWLSVYQTTISGAVPNDNNELGKIYQIKLHANTSVGGDSDPVTVLVKIGINKTLTPQFNTNLIFPELYAGHSYLYDFVAYNVIWPYFDEIPYTVEFAKGHTHPDWLRIEDNKLIADLVPTNTDFTILYLTIKNIPGGTSKVNEFYLVIRDEKLVH